MRIEFIVDLRDKYETELDGLNKKQEQQARINEQAQKKLDQLRNAQDKTTQALKEAGAQVEAIAFFIPAVIAVKVFCSLFCAVCASLTAFLCALSLLLICVNSFSNRPYLRLVACLLT